jgi:putative ABC transporter, ATP-binding protein
MKLRIERFAKIKEAEIELDGITVIAGYNDTGKSTIGKILYSVFNSLKSIDKSVNNKRKNDIQKVCSEITTGVYGNRHIFMAVEDGTGFLEIERILVNKIMEFKGDLTIDEYRNILNEVIAEEDKKGRESEIEDYVETSYSKISAIKNTSQEDLYKEIIERYFSNIFFTQINNCYYPDEEAKINLNIKGKDIKLLFRNNKCMEIELPINILHEAFLIDDPFILDNIVYGKSSLLGISIREQLIRKIMYQRDNLLDGIFDAVVAKESLRKINDVLDKVVNGEIKNTKDGMQYISANHEEPISVMNLSAGLKGFVLIKTLLERGILKEKDVLILDEPEIHMHTEWQLIYAEIIVLIQKYFDMTILVTTHSSHFLQAIEYFSKKYEIENKCHYYLSKSKDSGVTFENVTNNIDKIHSEMVEPSIRLDRLEEELEDERKDEF